ncbi:MAG: LysR family transcriptional regulator [Asticcacaulis sp.]|uniref:LysR family transcriptional regulator n=1 Tax=Asticcacaulis sp. TaxID=1872648 RepID=UPI0039E6B758
MEVFKLRRLWAVQAVYETGSTLKAADLNHISQSAVADAVSACETDLDTRLFERSSRGMAPTAAGDIWCSRVTAAATYLKAAEDALRTRRGRTALPFQRMVTETQLRALSAIIETGNFSQAARLLAVSQPSVHRAARELETLCGLSLWRRDGARIEPTPEARAIAQYADLFFSEISRAREAVRELQGVMDGALRIGALPLARSRWLPDALAGTLRAFPDARVSLLDGPYNEQLSALLHGRIDFLLGALRMPAPEGIVQTPIFDDPFVILVRAGHPLALNFDSDKDKLTPEQLGSLSWILPRGGTPGRDNFEAFIRAKGQASPRRVVESASLVATQELLLRTDHAAVLSAQQVGGSVSAGLLKVMGPPLTGSSRRIGISVRQGFIPTQLQAIFLEHLQTTS